MATMDGWEKRDGLNVIREGARKEGQEHTDKTKSNILNKIYCRVKNSREKAHFETGYKHTAGEPA